MGMFLNSKAPYEAYKKMTQHPYFVDKTMLLSELMPLLGSTNCYCCITRPRRFGKTVMANMVGAFFGKTDRKENIFGHLAISGQKSYEACLNQYNLFFVDFSKAPRGCKT